MHNLRKPHLADLKRILRYVRGIITHDLQLHVSFTSQLAADTEMLWIWRFPWSTPEYRGVANVVAEKTWVRNLLPELHAPLFKLLLDTAYVFLSNVHVHVLHVGSLICQVACYCVFSIGDNPPMRLSAKCWVSAFPLSSVEAEYRDVANVVAKTTWVRNLLRELHAPLFTTTLIYFDNVSDVYMSTNPVQR
ncbi:ribonuclease H-like domain-containing protein [Tanacetum coccineum]